ncbi:hypothetical protein ABXT47_03950 [Candidatus Pelagibacter sp. Uisw_099_02]|uniref:hypothetical protein n=1 Tax=Candidatus Pelagibacter sp. Uisw_099_02 TaxID=3230981 RepID=UPI002370E455|nr:hypothetical protein [Candidatus Pelagibacter sp.]|tara:strand:+ start:9 stop:833 length:825 start_codon:yes stop_codon:yes gene_type:complete
MNLSKFTYAYERFGFVGFLNVLLGKIGIKFRLDNQLIRLISYHSKRVEKLTKKIIIGGFYKGTKLNLNKGWSRLDGASKYLGLYEYEVQDEISKIQKNRTIRKKYFVNIGAGDGFHALGLLKKKYFNKAILFEKDTQASDLLLTNAKINRLKNNIELFKEAKINFLNDFSLTHKLKDCLFLIDIEGDEFKLLNAKNLKLLNKSILVIEIHDFYQNPTPLKKKLKKYFKIKTVTTGMRDLSKYKILNEIHDNEKWLVVNEDRPKKMEWLICLPKN